MEDETPDTLTSKELDGTPWFHTHLNQEFKAHAYTDRCRENIWVEIRCTCPTFMSKRSIRKEKLIMCYPLLREAAAPSTTAMKFFTSLVPRELSSSLNFDEVLKARSRGAPHSATTPLSMTMILSYCATV